MVSDVRVSGSLPELSVRQWLVWQQRRVAYRWRRLTFDAERVSFVVVPPGPDGRPGERVLVPSPSVYRSQWIGADGSREDFRVVIGRGGSTFAAVCLGSTEERGDPLTSAWRTCKQVGGGRYGSYSPPVEEAVAGTNGYRYRIAVGAKRLTEWKFAYGGWLFVAGALALIDDDEATMIARGQSILDSWQWLTAPSHP